MPGREHRRALHDGVRKQVLTDGHGPMHGSFRHALFDRLVGRVKDVELLSEGYDPVADRMVGNFSRAFSHLRLVRAAVHLADCWLGPW